MTQLNTPYPSTAYLTGFLRSRGIAAVQEDLALALVLRLFTPAGLDAVQARALALAEADRSASVHAFIDQFDDLPRHHRPGDPLPARRRLHAGAPHRRARPAARGPALLPRSMRMKMPSLATRAATHWPGPLVRSACRTKRATSPRSTSTIWPMCCATRWTSASNSCATPSRWPAASPRFEPLATALAAPPTLIDDLLTDLTLRRHRPQHQPTLVLLSVPFPGSVYAALRIGQTIKAHNPHVKHRARRRLCEHRAARAHRAACLRLRGLRDARRRRAPGALADRTPAAASAAAAPACAPLCATAKAR